MSISDTSERFVAPSFGLNWGPAVAGAIAASALAFVLDSFGVAIGLALSSTSPTWRDTSFAFVLLSGLYLVLAALASYCLGGYIVRSDAAPIRSGRALRASRRNARPFSLGNRDSPCRLYSGSYLALIASHTKGGGSDTKRDEFGTWGKPHCLRA